jgi:hypothetical protein
LPEHRQARRTSGGARHQTPTGAGFTYTSAIIDLTEGILLSLLRTALTGHIRFLHEAANTNRPETIDSA